MIYVLKSIPYIITLYLALNSIKPEARGIWLLVYLILADSFLRIFAILMRRMIAENIIKDLTTAALDQAIIETAREYRKITIKSLKNDDKYKLRS